MDGPSIEHSDSDSGESWTLLESNSVYADEPPEFLDDQERTSHHHEKDEDTDGISIISDSDHDAPTPPPGDIVREKYQVLEENLSEKDISDFVSVDPPANNDDHDPAESNEFLGDSHVTHKTYVHKRNKQLSTVLNIIVLGSVITAAGVAIGHMWGARHDCAIQTTSSINKILSNLYKLQEENAYLKAKIKELTQPNIQQQKIHLKQSKCRKVFEDSLSNNEPRKFTKCVDEHNIHGNNLIEHFTKPEKEFVADMDKLKTVYLQNKSWLDDEISRRVKIEEELLKKYNDEINSEKEQIEEFSKNNEVDLTLPSDKITKEEILYKLHRDENLDSKNLVQQKISYADSLKNEQKPKSKRNVESYEDSDNSDWSMLNPNFEEDTMRGSKNDRKQQNKIANLELNEVPIYASGYVNDLTNSMQFDNNNRKEQDISTDAKTEEDIKFRRNEKWYETEDENWSKFAQEAKDKRKKDKREAKRNAKLLRTEKIKDKNNEDRTVEFTTEGESMKDDRYVINKLNKEKKKNGYNNSNKKQKRKGRFDKFNMKGEFGEKFDDVATPDLKQYTLNNPDKHDNSDYVPIVTNIYDTEKSSEKLPDKEDTLEKRSNNKEPAGNWFEKRAVLRTEARKKYYEQFGESSINNSSWYFRRMRKREQCRAKGDNSTFKKLRKEKKGHKIKE